MRDNPYPKDGAVERFLSHFGPFVTAVLSGFDRLVFRGHLMALIREGGMSVMLNRAGVRLLDFGRYVHDTSERVKAACLRDAIEQRRPVEYLPSAATDKEARARRLFKDHPVREGLICIFKTVEPCMSFEYHRSPDLKERGLKLRPRKCTHIYRYSMHPVFGFINARIQTWFPFNVQICLNGREWLAKQFERWGRIDFEREDNCFVWLNDPEFAQRLMDRQLAINWKAALDGIARELNPVHRQIFKPWPMDYYWSAYQTEWATDLLFVDQKTLAAIYPSLVHHAMTRFKSPDIMRFLGRKVSGNFTGEIVSSFKNRPEGIRVKHWVRGNSIKMYDKAGSVLRVETTIAKTTDFKVFRPVDDHDPKAKLAWLGLRKGIADLHRRAEVSQQANKSYLDALATVDDTTPMAQLVDRVARPVTHRGYRVRALRIADPGDTALFQAIARGEFAIAGFRNRDLRVLLHPSSSAWSPREVRKCSARISRQLRLLRAHGIIRKVPKTHRYLLTDRGRTLTTALAAMRAANVKQLLALSTPAA